MKRFATVALAALCVGVPASAQEKIAITGGRVVTGTGAPVDNATLLLSGGKVVGVSPGGAVPAGYARVDAAGKWVTPGIVAGLAQLGLAEVHGEASANDTRAPRSVLSAALDATPGLNASETAIPVSRAEGVTSAVVAPIPSAFLFAGQGAVISLGQNVVQPIAERAFQYVAYGEAAARTAGGSRLAAWAELVNALDEGKRYAANPRGYGHDQSKDLRLTPADAQALAEVVRGRQPLLVRVDRASDIRQILKLRQMYPGIRLVLVSVAEGWLVAPEIAAAKVPVVTLGMDDLPNSFESLGATLSNVGRMAAAGVRVALGTPDLETSFQPRALPQYAGNMVAQAKLPGQSGLSWDQAFAAITATPADIFGLSDRGRLKAGAVADVVIWNGDPLELSSYPVAVYVNGVQQSLESRQTKLARRYQPGRDSSQLPPEYRD